MINQINVVLDGPICKCKKQCLLPKYQYENKLCYLFVECVFCKTSYKVSSRNHIFTITCTKPYPEGYDTESVVKESKIVKEKQDKIQADNLKAKAEEKIRRGLN